MSKIVILQQCAIEDLTSIVGYYIDEVDNPKYAQTILTLIKQAVLQLPEMPYIGAIIQEQPYKALAVRRLMIKNYIIFYKVKDNEISILRILNMRQQWQEYL